MQRLRRTFVIYIPLLYALFGLVWILVTDRILVRLAPTLAEWASWQTGKGALFVLASTLLIALLLRRASRVEREALQALHAREETLRRQGAALEAAADAIVITAPDGTVQWVNPAFTRLTGYTSAEALGKNPRDLVKSGAHDQVFYKELWSTILAGRVWRGQMTNRRKDGTLYYEEQSITPLCDEQGRITHFIAIKHDISRRKAEQAERDRLLRTVQDQAEQLREIMYGVPDGVCMMRPDGTIAVANPRAREFLALLAGAGLGQRLTHLGSETLDHFLTTPPRGRWHEVQQDERIFELASRPLEAGSVAQGWVLVIRDVTEQRLVQRQLQRQERLASIGQMAAGIAHDFNNIMGVILLEAQLMAANRQLPERERERVSIIAGQAGRAAHLIQQILDFSRRAIMERQPLDLLALLQEEVRLLQRTLPENMQTTLDFRAGDYALRADQARMQQAIMNLALNARDAMPHGGRLHFALDTLHVSNAARAPVPGMTPGDWIRLRVSDSGMGIAPQMLESIFEPFFTTKEPGKGTGLGLSQVHGIVSRHDGHITVDSRLGEGTTFTIYLPASSPVTELTADGDAVAVPQGRGQLLLVVEDEPSLRHSLAETLQLFAYQVLCAANGEEALALLAEKGQEVALVISDVVMPKMGGLALLHAARRQGFEHSFLFMTGHAPEPTLEQLPQASQLLLKPVSPTRLLQAVGQALGHA